MNILKITIILFFCMISIVPDLSSEGITPQSDKPHIATILQHLPAGKYTYLKLDEQGEEVWIATMNKFLKKSVTIGEKVEYKGGLLMANFKSETLDMTFDSILFITRIKILSKISEDIPVHDSYIKEKGQIEKAVPPSKGEIVKAKEGWTISDIFTKKDELRGKEVMLRAKVMKISKNILSKNWISLRDGTGDAPYDEIVYTTTKTAQINDIITISGIVRTDVNGGGSYKYSVLIEDNEGTKILGTKP